MRLSNLPFFRGQCLLKGGFTVRRIHVCIISPVLFDTDPRAHFYFMNHSKARCLISHANSRKIIHRGINLMGQHQIERAITRICWNLLGILVIRHSARSNYSMWLLNFIWVGFLKAITLITREHKYFDLETFAELWNPPFNRLLPACQNSKPEIKKIRYWYHSNLRGASVWNFSSVTIIHVK